MVADVAQEALRALEPLNEVVLGVSFVAPGFTIIDYGLFFERIRQMYPVVAVQPPLATANEFGQPLIFPDLPRVWYLSKDQHTLVQLQENRLLFNWRKVGNVGNYPRFAALFDGFMNARKLLVDLISERNSGPFIEQQFEFSYVNNILPEFREQVHGPLFKWESRDWNKFLPSPTRKVVQYLFKFPEDNADLRVLAQPALDVTSQKEVTTFQLNAVSKIPEPAEKWFERIHDILANAFEDLLTDDALALWRRTS